MSLRILNPTAGTAAGLVFLAACMSVHPLRAQVAAGSTVASSADIDSANPAMIDPTGSCGDALSAALQQDGASTPCWADIRTVDHWNTTRLADNATIQGGPGFLPAVTEQSSNFSFAVGGLAGLVFSQGTDSQAYAGAGAMSGFVQRRRWKLMYEDGGALGDYQAGAANLVGLNRGAVRMNGELSSRWLWQGSVTNTYANDTVRTVAPLDFRTVGQTEAPVIDTVAYGLHSGNLVDQQEDVKLRYATSRRTNWDFSAAHTLRYYSDDGVDVQTIRGRAQYIHSVSPRAAVGLLGTAAHQTGPSECSLAGGGGLGLLQWGSRASISVSGSVNGASSSCGKNVQFTGDASLYLHAGDHTDLYLTGNRDLSDGVIEQVALLSSAGGGVRYAFSPRANLRLGGAAIYGTNPATSVAYNGAFAEAAATFPIAFGLLEETSYRHYQVDNISTGDNRNVVTFTVWWSPKKNQQTLAARK